MCSAYSTGSGEDFDTQELGCEPTRPLKRQYTNRRSCPQEESEVELETSCLERPERSRHLGHYIALTSTAASVMDGAARMRFYGNVG